MAAKPYVATGLVFLGLAVVGVNFFGWWRHEIELLLLLYVIVITVMACGAWSVLGSPHLALPGRIMVFVGALSFYFSDIFVARDRFIHRGFLNRLMGLPLYYSGQFLLAFSVGLL